MPTGWIGAALLCLCLPWLWFYWGPLPAALTGGILCLLFWARPKVLLALFVLLLVQLMRLELERAHPLARAFQHDTAQLTLCIESPLRQYEYYQSGLARVAEQPPDLSLRRVRLSADNGIAVQPGDCIQGRWRLRQPIGRLLPGQFNATRYYLTERIDALVSLVEPVTVDSRPGLAARLYQRVQPHFEDDATLAVWAALALGWGSAMPATLAEVFNQAQVRHLLVVSGMHVGMVAGWIWFLVPLLQRLSVARMDKALPGLRNLAVLAGAGGYVALTGFGYPGIRAWVMLAVPLVLLSVGVKLNRTQLMAIAATVLALFQPQAWLAPGAWLSFGLVWVLLALSNRWRDQGLSRWQLAVRSQVGISVFMLPVSILFGFYLHPLGVLINLLVIPLVTLVVLPWSLLIACFGAWSAPGLYEVLIVQGLRVLTWVAEGHLVAPSLQWPTWGLMCLLLLLLSGQLWQREQRWVFGAIAGLALWLALRPGALDAEFRMTLFDVGHGQAILLQWPGETWLYDTAPHWGETSFAERQLQPWLRRHGVQLDGIIVSHADLDHAGGARWFASQWPSADRWSGQARELIGATGLKGWRNCHQGSVEASQRFNVIAVPEVLQRDANDHSCLLWVSTSAGPVMITGDASRYVEYWLLQEHAHLLPLAVHVLGHHGSPGSSARAFLEASPDARLLVSGADRARPRWPSDQLSQWLSEHKRPLHNTAHSGTVAVEVRQGRIEIRDWSSHYRRSLLDGPDP
ncbi:MAG: DNA internalization-related competence protein ComEC/Rec2 [Saccharospirillum sp.]